MKTTFKKVFAFQKAAMIYLQHYTAETKLLSAIKDVLEQLTPINEDYRKKSTRIQRNNAAEDESKCLIKDDKGNYRFTRVGEEAVEEQLDVLNNEEATIDITPQLVGFVPKTLEKAYIKAFAGFVFEADTPTEE